MEKLYTIPEVADYLGVTRQAVYKWMRAGQLRYVRVGADRRVTESALRAFIKPGEESRENPTTDRGETPPGGGILGQISSPALALPFH